MFLAAKMIMLFDFVSFLGSLALCLSCSAAKK